MLNIFFQTLQFFLINQVTSCLITVFSATSLCRRPPPSAIFVAVPPRRRSAGCPSLAVPVAAASFSFAALSSLIPSVTVLSSVTSPSCNFRAISIEVSIVTTLVATHVVGIISPTLTACSWSGKCNPYATSTNFYSITSLKCSSSIFFIFIYRKPKTGSTVSHPDLFYFTEGSKDFFQITSTHIITYISNVEAISIGIVASAS